MNHLLLVLVAAMVPLGSLLAVALAERGAAADAAVPTAVAGIVTLVPEGLVLLTSLTYAIAAQAFISFFEKVQALEKRKPGVVAKAFADHPQTPDRIEHSQEEISHILPAKDEYTVTTSEFDDIKARLARIENKRRLTDSKDGKKPSLRKASTSKDDPNTPAANPNGNPSDQPTLHRREDNN